MEKIITISTNTEETNVFPPIDIGMLRTEEEISNDYISQIEGIAGVTASAHNEMKDIKTRNGYFW